MTASGVDCFLLLRDVGVHPGVFVDSPNPDEDCLALSRPGNQVEMLSNRSRAYWMSDTHQSRPGTAATERYEALFAFPKTFISIRSSEELFRLLASELRAVVNFYVMGVGIYDEGAHQIRLTSYGEPGVPLQVPQFAPEETFTWWVYQHQQPLIIPSLELGTPIPSGCRDAQEPRGPVGMRASIDDKYIGVSEASLWAAQKLMPIARRSQLSIVRREPSGAGSG